MKKIILFSIYTFFTIQSFGQIKVTTLMNILKMNYNQFENYSLENGWTLDKVENSKNYEGVVYTKGSGSKKEFITLYKKYFNEGNHVEFQTSNKEHYILFKNEIIKNGFKLKKTETKENIIRYTYTKNVNIYLDIEMGILQIPPYVNQNKYGGWEIYLTQKFNKEKLILDTPQ
jgi:hypothetical protein